MLDPNSTHFNEKFLTVDYLEEFFVKAKVDVINSDLGIKPLVSVLFITYNHIDYIRQSLDGILMQVTSFDWEILIGDDESTDGTREICQEYARKYPNRIKLFLHKRENNISILNKPSGIFQMTYNILRCQGKYIAVCSGDDVWTDPYKLQKQLDLLEKEDNIILSYHPFVRYGDVLANINLPELERFSNMPKASTMFFRNINKILPINFIDAIQEDVFLWHLLRFKGQFALQADIEPSIICTPLSSITRSLDEQQHFLHVLNINIQIFKSIDLTMTDIKQKRFVSYNLVSMLFNASYTIEQKKHLLNTFRKMLSVKDVYYALHFKANDSKHFKNYFTDNTITCVS
ncbi:glycosyltransferase family 2 protein [Flavobacterium ardleyense]|uniref:glycosyltransferase family 2 protein n=1 Tax=Flavobacterium ardleyense TaxID=2038737 RepID=UPI00298CDCD3|nr:glycosyltransferase [Flavobacterium ardleyense]